MNALIASFLMLLTTVIHTGASMLVPRIVTMEGAARGGHLARVKSYWIGAVVILMFFASLLEVVLWAATYLALDALHDFETALYFSMVTFTTLGYGDVVLEDRWRLLSSFEAVNGIIMFGWTTAVVLYAFQQLFQIKHAGRI